jgi:hypothetical protein
LVVRVISSSPSPRWREPADEVHRVAAHQRLAAGEADLAHPARDESIGYEGNLIEAQQLGARQEGHMLRHAIAAAQVAAIGHRYPQIVDRAAMGVDQGGRGCHVRR